MKFKTGDKVKFLNKVGGGYVTQVLDNAMVRIISDGGLEYPVPEKEIIQETGATTIKEMGKIMGVATKKLAGKTDNKTISEIVKELLSNQ